MEQIMYHNINDTEYLGIITVLDHEPPIKSLLQDVCFYNIENSKGKKIVVDLLIKSGNSNYRFMTFDFLNNGKISFPTGTYFIPNNNIIQKANCFWKTKKELLKGSIITPLIQEELFA